MLTHAAALRIAARAVDAAQAIPCPMCIAVVDAGANLLHFERMDDAMGGSIETAIRKARCAALFKRPTKAFEDMLAGGRTAVMSLPDVLPIEGGIPLLIDGKVAGAVGISGGSAPQDGAVARDAAEALSVRP
jgi:uncharacterized protein GlcG (DUF336 family)